MTPRSRAAEPSPHGGHAVHDDTGRGHELLATLAHNLGRLLSEPLFAAVLGFAVGLGLLVFSRLSFRVMRPEAPELGLALSVMMLFFRMALVATILVAYRAVAGPGFVPFAMSMAGGFFIGYTVELLRYGKLLPTVPALRARSTR